MTLPSPRFGPSHSELLRFAKACGLLEAQSAEARAAAVEAGVGRVVRTLDWVKRQHFMDARWGGGVWWSQGGELGWGGWWRHRPG